MNAKKFSDAMSELGSKYVDEAIHYKKKKNKKNTLILEAGNITKYAPKAAEIAPLAPTIGISLCGLKKI